MTVRNPATGTAVAVLAATEEMDAVSRPAIDLHRRLSS